MGRLFPPPPTFSGWWLSQVVKKQLFQTCGYKPWVNIFAQFPIPHSDPSDLNYHPVLPEWCIQTIRLSACFHIIYSVERKIRTNPFKRSQIMRWICSKFTNKKHFVLLYLDFFFLFDLLIFGLFFSFQFCIFMEYFSTVLFSFFFLGVWGFLFWKKVTDKERMHTAGWTGRWGGPWRSGKREKHDQNTLYTNN